MTALAAPPPLVQVVTTGDGKEASLHLNFHPGQARAWLSDKRFILVLAGTQGGKTSFGPLWLYREITLRGPGDYMVVAPMYKLLNLKALPEFLRLFKSILELGTYNKSDYVFEMSKEGELALFGAHQDQPTRVLFGHAADPDSLASATAKAVWLDEAGQKKFKYYSWIEIRKRLSLARGRALLTTTPYCMGWLKEELHDKALAGDPNVCMVRFDSTENPAFPMEEFEDARRTLPKWMFDLSYRAIFTRPAGLIYDNFHEEDRKWARFPILPQWNRYLGLDFGGVNTAGVFYAEDPRDGKWYAYREYHAGGRTAKQHVEAILEGEPGIPYCVGGSKSEDQWRAEFTQAGLPVNCPDFHEVEVGINRVYAAHADRQIRVFDDLKGYLDQKASYGRKLDDAGNVLEEIEDKETYHFCDAERYIIGWLRRGEAEFGPSSPKARSAIANAPPGVFADQRMPEQW